MSPPSTRLLSSAPRYQQVAEKLQGAIARGDHPVGALLPPEPQLCEQFGVSRHTLREAVRILCEMGMLVRQQGVGTRVKRVEPQHRFVATLDSLADLMQYTQETRLNFLASRRVEVRPPLSNWLECAPGELWIELDNYRSRLDEDVPLAHMKVYVRPECEAIVDEVRDGDGRAWIYGLVERHGGEPILQVRQTISAVAMPRESARILNVKAGSPGLQVRRQYAGAQRVLSISVNVYPLDLFEFVTTWRLNEANPDPLR